MMWWTHYWSWWDRCWWHELCRCCELCVCELGSCECSCELYRCGSGWNLHLCGQWCGWCLCWTVALESQDFQSPRVVRTSRFILIIIMIILRYFFLIIMIRSILKCFKNSQELHSPWQWPVIVDVCKSNINRQPLKSALWLASVLVLRVINNENYVIFNKCEEKLDLYFLVTVLWRKSDCTWELE